MAALMRELSVILTVHILIACAFVQDLEDGFLEQKKEGLWLVMFYAPWCGHCKKLEPVYEEVAVSLRTSSITVGRIDCTRYSYIATELEIKGFPTIKFFDREKAYSYRGDRTTEDIIEFSKKAQGPALRPLASIGRYNEASLAHKNTVFFMYVGDMDPENDMLIKYSELSERFIVQSYFYIGHERILPQNVKLRSTPTIVVFKDSTFYEYEPLEGATMFSVEDWINVERFKEYPLTSGAGLNDLAETGRFIVMAVIDTETTEDEEENDRIKNMVGQVASKHRDEYHSKFLFCWMSDSESVNNIVMWTVSFPNLLVLDPNTQIHYMPNVSVGNMTSEWFRKFLHQVTDGEIEGAGGTGYYQNAKRIFYDILTMFMSIWNTSRWLCLLIFGLPTAIISFCCYALCCMDSIETEHLSDDEGDGESEDRSIQAAANEGNKSIEPATQPAVSDEAATKEDTPDLADMEGLSTETSVKPTEEKKND